MNTCKRCQASIPTGRSFCTPHYMEALVDYESSMVTYQNEMAAWNSMSSKEQSAAHFAAEQTAVVGYAAFVGLIIGGLIWYKNFPGIDALLGVCILVVSVFFCTIIKPSRILIGHLARLFVHALGYFCVAWIAGAIVSIWSPFIKENAPALSFGLAFAVVVLSGVLEVSGGHHASGAPSMPTKPSP